jgi:triacylglycerol lipase
MTATKRSIQSLFYRFLIITGFLYSASSQAGCWWWESCDEYETEYPIVLVHGVSGWDTIFGIDHFYRVRSVLEKRGAEVYTPNVIAWEDAYDRGEVLIEQLDDLRAVTGASKFNLIGHSLGGPTIRYVSGIRPDLVASITTVNAVNYGSDFADVARGLVPTDSTAESIVATALELVGNITDTLSGNPEYEQGGLDAVTFMTSAGAAEFNARFPDGEPTSRCGQGAPIVNGIHYYSWGGSSSFTNALDITDPFLFFTGSVIDGPNDGLVERCDQHWGKVIKSNYRMNHLDAINQVFGIHHLFETDPLTVYQNHAARLKQSGL